MIRNWQCLAVLLCAGAVAAHAAGGQERGDRTGTRLRSDTTPRAVYRFDTSGKTQRILDLIEQGRTDEAVDVARDYVGSLSGAVGVNAAIQLERYFALNALGVALTKAGRIDEAVDTCSDAVGMFPSRWTALNTRATAYYTSRRFDRALEDYRRALEVAPDDESVRAMLDHNIQLAEQRLAETGAAPARGR